MALPKLETPKHSCVLPTTNETVYFRPFLVGEQKVLLIAQESEDANEQIREMMRLINICCDDVDVNSIPTVDLEYLFLQLRIKSVGETSDVILNCDKCETGNPVSVELENTKLTESENKISNIVKLTDIVSMELQYPSYSMMEDLDAENAEDTKSLFRVMTKCIVSVIDGDEVHTKDDFTTKELTSFLDSMSLTMFNDVQEFFNSAPKLSIDVNFECKECETKNHKELEGVGNFFD